MKIKIKGLRTKLERIESMRIVFLMVSLIMLFITGLFPKEDTLGRIVAFCVSIFFLVLFVYFNAELRHIQVMREIKKT